MQITVKLFATFRQDRFKLAEQDYPEGTTIADVLDALAIAAPDVGMLFVNGRSAEPERRLASGAVLAIFPLVGGG
ncbi:MAG: MoaD/ThiS family protein [Ancalomicrobiaceae bacterium]|nr:MoaD/ThiS family protein [Ancalomicrobiaceae bacterium]